MKKSILCLTMVSLVSAKAFAQEWTPASVPVTQTVTADGIRHEEGNKYVFLYRDEPVLELNCSANGMGTFSKSIAKTRATATYPLLPANCNALKAAMFLHPGKEVTFKLSREADSTSGKAELVKSDLPTAQVTETLRFDEFKIKGPDGGDYDVLNHGEKVGELTGCDNRHGESLLQIRSSLAAENFGTLDYKFTSRNCEKLLAGMSLNPNKAVVLTTARSGDSYEGQVMTIDRSSYNDSAK